MFRNKIIISIALIVFLILILTVSFFYTGYSVSGVTRTAPVYFNSATPSAVIFSESVNKDFTVGYQTLNLNLPNNSLLKVFISDTDKKRSDGLSNWPSLPTDTGMLFIFDQSEFLGFWMKDMKFALDMVWLDENKNVVDVRENVLPETYPKVFMPTVKAKYVLEVPAGFCVKNKITLGSKIIWADSVNKKTKKTI
jgi:uncharacterized membrane protein (UPF0127 family)